MIRRIVGIALAGIGLVVLVLSVGSATLWRPADTVSASVKVPAGAALRTDPGVLSLYADTVSVKVSGGDGDYVFAVGRDSDVEAWLKDTKTVRLTGLSDSTKFSSKTENGSKPPSSAADSDLWISSVVVPAGKPWKWSTADVPANGRWSLLVLPTSSGRDHAGAYKLEATWPQVVKTPFLWPGVVLGALLLLAGAVTLILLLLKRRNILLPWQRHRRVQKASDATQVLSPVPAVPMSERVVVGSKEKALWEGGEFKLEAAISAGLNRQQIRALRQAGPPESGASAPSESVRPAADAGKTPHTQVRVRVATGSDVSPEGAQAKRMASNPIQPVSMQADGDSGQPMSRMAIRAGRVKRREPKVGNQSAPTAADSRSISGEASNPMASGMPAAAEPGSPAFGAPTEPRTATPGKVEVPKSIVPPGGHRKGSFTPVELLAPQAGSQRSVRPHKSLGMTLPPPTMPPGEEPEERWSKAWEAAGGKKKEMHTDQPEVDTEEPTS